MFKRIFDIDPWVVQTHQLDGENIRLMESITSIGNGYMGMRGNFEEGYSGDTHQGTYLAGVWYPDKTRVGWWKNGYPDYFGKVINSANFTKIQIWLDDAKLDLNQQQPTNFQVSLNLKEGILRRSFDVKIAEKVVHISFERFFSIVNKEISYQHLTIKLLKGDALKVKVSSEVDGDVRNEDSNYEEKFWNILNTANKESWSLLQTKTIPNNFGIEEFYVSYGMKNTVASFDHKETLAEESKVVEVFEKNIQMNETFDLEKVTAVLTSRDIPFESQLDKLSNLLNQQENLDYSLQAEKQKAAWAKRWEQSDIAIEGSKEDQQGIRFNLFQLFSTYYGEDARLNVGPKGFTGEKYGGATYWDTEACIIPMYLAVTPKEVSEKLLEYRFNQLPEAKINASKQGLKGALYPMVTFTGIECHNEWEITFEEIHRNGSMAFAIYNYTQYHQDESYLLEKGIDVLVELSHFWADRVHYSQRNQQYMIHGVTGPNEYENNVNNNWYTNYMARWTLQYTLETLEKVSDDKKNQFNLAKETLDKWQDIINKMYLPADKELGIFVQHDTFLDKDLKPVTALSKEERPINQHWSWDKILRSCFIKQADVLQAMYYFPESFTNEEVRQNFDFYEPMTVHESSLSPMVHAILAARLGKEEKAVEMYKRTSRLDLDNYNNDTEDGLHITSMSGGWLSIVHGFAGMETNHGLKLNPFCPKDWESYTFKIKYLGRLLQIKVDKEKVSIDLLNGEPLSFKVYNQEVVVKDNIIVLK